MEPLTREQFRALLVKLSIDDRRVDAVELTYGELYDPAMRIEKQQDASSYLDALVTYTQRRMFHRGKLVPAPEVAAIHREWLGYWAGYFDDETRERVERLFACEHPFFGSIAKNGPPSAEQAFRMGVAYGEAMKEGASQQEALRRIKQLRSAPNGKPIPAPRAMQIEEE